MLERVNTQRALDKLKKFVFLGLLILLTTGAAFHVYGAKDPGTEPVSVIFYENDGTKIIDVKKTSKGWLRLPTMKNTETHTFMGWSMLPRQKVAPQYQPGDVITAKRKTRLYAVMYKRKREENINAKNLPKLDTNKYSKVIFVGDSRTRMLMNRMKAEASRAQLGRLGFVCKSGRGIGWLKKTGMDLLLKEIQAAKKKYPKDKIAVVFNFGVNDLRIKDGMRPNCKLVAKQYVEYMNKISRRLQKRDCRLFYMSVNPVNSSMTKEENIRRTEEIRYLNKALETGLCDAYTYLDCYDYLMSTGYSTGKNYADPDYRDDGVHYTPMTYKRIYRFCMNKINKS